MSILRMVGSMLANKSAILIIQQQADTDDNADSDDDFMMTIAQSALNGMQKIDGRIRRHRMQFRKI